MRNKLIAWTGALLLVSGGALAQDATPNDAQIAGIVVTANQIDIDNGQLAERKAGNREVKDFARQMVTDHGGSNKAAKDLARQLKLKPEENATSTSLKASGDETRKKLLSLNGGEFDKAYIDSEVTFHQKVLDTIDKSLLPNAKHEELKALLTKTRPVIADHLEHARRLQASLGKKTP